MIIITQKRVSNMLSKKTTTLLSSNVMMDNPALEMRYRQTKIIFTIGPATSNDEVLKQLINERVDICRIYP
jgi:hypothetical protein